MAPEGIDQRGCNRWRNESVPQLDWPVPPTPRRRRSLRRARFSMRNWSTGAAVADPVGAAAVLVDRAGAAPASVPVGVDQVRSGGAVRQFRRASSDSASESPRRASFLLARWRRE